jgi:hypothetical protein
MHRFHFRKAGTPPEGCGLFYNTTDSAWTELQNIRLNISCSFSPLPDRWGASRRHAPAVANLGRKDTVTLASTTSSIYFARNESEPSGFESRAPMSTRQRKHFV